VTSLKFIKTILQAGLIALIAAAGNFLADFLNIPIAGSIVGLILFYLLLQFRILPENWVKDGANLFVGLMIFFFIPSIVGGMDAIQNMNINYLLIMVIVLGGTITVAFVSGYVAEKITKKSAGEEK
jgi:holin-like protein